MFSINFPELLDNGGESSPSFHRSSRLELSCKKGALKNFARFTGKHLCQSLFFNKVAGLRPAKKKENLA